VELHDVVVVAARPSCWRQEIDRLPFTFTSTGEFNAARGLSATRSSSAAGRTGPNPVVGLS
jgi:hypothetical protein